MVWKNKSLETKLLTCVMSVVLLAGLIFLPAFAEAAPDETTTFGDLVTAEMMPAEVLRSAADDDEQSGPVTVEFIRRKWDGTKVVEELVSGSAVPVPSDGSMTTGWYYLNRDVTVDKRIYLTGNTYLILGDNCTLDVKGIYIPKGKTLYILDQVYGSGKLVSTPSDGAAIGGYSGHKGGSVVIQGGNVEVTGAKNCAGIGSNDGEGSTAPIIVYGGKVMAKGGDKGAGIGGGRDCSGGMITIYGGNITAWSVEGGAGIGGGEDGDGGSITIKGGMVYAGLIDDSYDSVNENGAGIGGGDGGTVMIKSGDVITRGSESMDCGRGIMMINDDEEGLGTTYIQGGTVEAYGYDDYPGISAEWMNVVITGGDVYAHSDKACGIGGAQDEGMYGDVRIEGAGTVVRAISEEYAGIDGGFHGDRTIRGDVSYGPGITLELWSPSLGKYVKKAWCHNR